MAIDDMNSPLLVGSMVDILQTLLVGWSTPIQHRSPAWRGRSSPSLESAPGRRPSTLGTSFALHTTGPWRLGVAGRGGLVDGCVPPRCFYLKLQRNHGWMKYD